MQMPHDIPEAELQRTCAEFRISTPICQFGPALLTLVTVLTRNRLRRAQRPARPVTDLKRRAAGDFDD